MIFSRVNTGCCKVTGKKSDRTNAENACKLASESCKLKENMTELQKKWGHGYKLKNLGWDMSQGLHNTF